MADKSDDNSRSPPPTAPPSTEPPPTPGPSGPRSQTYGTEASGSPSPPDTGHDMARNKHWRYIYSYNGAWSQAPYGELEALAKSNWASPRPRAIDPALFFDLVTIRKLAEEACDISVRATAGIATSALSSPFTIAKSLRGSGVQALGLGSFGPGTGGQLSAERKFRMRELATQKLSKAYHLDELASSIVTMQGASVLEKVAGLVIESPRENVDRLDGKYVHFFHEKTNAEDMKKPEALTLINEVINGRHMSAEPLRTRAVAKMHQEKFAEAIEDLTIALQICRCQQSMHRPEPQASQNTANDSSKRKEKKLDDNDYPSSLETQLLFHRAGAYLDLACQTVEKALPPKGQSQSSSKGASNESDPGGPSVGGDPEAIEREKRCKSVKENAKRALRDYMAFLSQLDFTLELDARHKEAFDRRVYQAAVGIKLPRAPSSGIPLPVAHQISSLFSATPPIGLPSNPQTGILIEHFSAPENASGTSALHETAQQLLDSTNKRESLTYHPLLIEALHCLLLCHVLMQTSIRELHLHAHMAARLIRSCDGYPVFDIPRQVPSREDWVEVLSQEGDRFALGATWDVLCRPRLYRRGGVPPIFHEKGGDIKETEDEKRERLHKTAVLESLADKGVTDEETFKKALAARQKRKREEERKSMGKSDEHKDGASKNKARDEAHGVSSIRARNIVRWIREAPVIINTGTRRRRKGTRGRGSTRGRSGLSSSIGGLSVTDERSVDTPEELN
ncbi:hypothetical protein V493_02886 [Pseudogymnoascus sp. VKM F-4281 (FW-2241)]|nr:hypothetical protein V493_02886 [Pseudogymnoascus sp. VKM F-4281 (FW-2241)]